MNIVSTSLADTKRIAAEYIEFLKQAVQGKQLDTSTESKNKATIVGLEGDLGSGKTTFSQSVAEVLGVKDQVTSPTFVIEKIYQTNDDMFSQFIHIDAYRLEGGKELHVLDFQRLVDDPKNLIFIEWPEKVRDILPSDIFRISFTFLDEHRRRVEYDTN